MLEIFNSFGLTRTNNFHAGIYPKRCLMTNDMLLLIRLHLQRTKLCFGNPPTGFIVCMFRKSLMIKYDTETHTDTLKKSFLEEFICTANCCISSENNLAYTAANLLASMVTTNQNTCVAPCAPRLRTSNVDFKI